MRKLELSRATTTQNSEPISGARVKELEQTVPSPVTDAEYPEEDTALNGP